MADLIPLIGFVFFGLFSPGPNVILVTTSGARFGMRATVPHIVGVALGTGVIAGIAGLGLGVLLTTWPTLTLVLKVIAAGWIVWMAWGLWNARPVTRQSSERPFTLVQAILFQWVNPKIWAVALSAVAYVVTLAPTSQAIVLFASFTSINIVVCLFWAWAGTWLSALRENPAAWRVFMRIMAAALAFFSVAVFL